ncbi:MAG: transposase [Moraxellaceae bacterium]|nr:transposase [Moraxellaceae bacterium]
MSLPRVLVVTVVVLTLIRDEVVEKLDVIPAQFHVMRHIYPQMACRACETIVAAPSEASVIQGGLASARLLAWIIVSKFADHLPLYRLEQIAARQQVPLPRSTLSSWVGLVGYALGELVERLVKMLLQRAVLHADENASTTIRPQSQIEWHKKPICGRIAVIVWTRKTLSWYLIIKVIEKVVMYVRF